MSNLVLYRKYRPLTFSQVHNQEHVQTTLSNAVKSGRIGHAYLFTGPRGVGKTTLARIFARAINCLNPKDFEPCNECEVCKGFLEGSSLDLLEIDAASHTGVDNVRELIEHVQFAPAQAKYKVIIIDEVHMLSKPAFNALLKTLEEPPKHAVFILATTETHKVPATIISRTQRFDFKKVSIADLSKLLKFVCEDNQVKASEAALMEVAEAADGSFRDGLSLLDQVISYSGSEITEELVEQVLGLTGSKSTSEFLDLLIDNQAKEAMEYISTLSFNGKDLYQFQRDFLEYLRKILITKVGAKGQEKFAQEVHERLEAQAKRCDLPWLVKTIEVFMKAENDIKWASIQSLPLELAAVEVCGFTQTVKIAQEASVEPKQDKPQEAPQAPLKQPNTSNESPVVNLSFDEILQRWPQVLDKVKEYNQSLITSLKLASPHSLEGNALTISFTYKFHKEAVEARKNLLVLEQSLEEVLGQKIYAKPILAPTEVLPPQESPSPDSSALSSALKIMGGQVES